MSRSGSAETVGESSILAAVAVRAAVAIIVTMSSCGDVILCPFGLTNLGVLGWVGLIR